MTTRRATLFVLLAACCFGSVTIFTVIGRAGGATLVSLLAWRYLLGSAGLVVASGGPRAVRVPAARLPALLVLGGVGQAAVAFLSLRALDYIPAATLAFLFYTYPAWVAIFAAARRTERLTPVRVGALLLSLAGIVLMVGNPFRSVLPAAGVLLALGSAIWYAIYIPIIDRLQTGLSPTVTSAYVTAGASAVFIVAGLATGTLSLSLGAQSWGAVLGLALLCTVLAFTVFLHGLALLGAVRTAIISTLEPFWTALMGALVLGQPLTRGVVAGGACIALAIALLQWRPRAA